MSADAKLQLLVEHDVDNYLTLLHRSLGKFPEILVYDLEIPKKDLEEKFRSLGVSVSNTGAEIMRLVELGEIRRGEIQSIPISDLNKGEMLTITYTIREDASEQSVDKKKAKPFYRDIEFKNKHRRPR